MSNLKLEVLLKAVDQATRPFKAIQNASKSLSGDILGSQNTLRDLNSQAGQIEGFRKSSAQLAVTRQKLKDAKEEAAALAIGFRNTANPTRAQTKAMESAKRAATELETKFNGLRQSVQRQRTELSAAGINTRTLSDSERRLRASISDTTAQLNRQRESLARVSAQQEKLNAISARYERGKTAAAGVRNVSAAALGVGTAALYAGSRLMAPEVQTQQSGALIAARQGEDATQGAEYTDVIQRINGAGVSEDIEKITEAVSAVRSTLGTMGAVGEAELTRITRKALDMQTAFGSDAAESIQIAAIMMKNGLAGSSDEALDLITAGMQRVSAQMRGEMPEILHEYSTHFRNLGFSGAEAMSLLIDMSKQGKFALDKTGDAIKEFSIRGSDMSKASVAAYQQIGLNAGKMSRAIASGGAGARVAMQKTAKGLLSIKDPAARANAAIALFGTPIEDLSVDQIPAFLGALAGAKNQLGDVGGAADKMGSTLRDNLSGDVARLQGSFARLRFTAFAKMDGHLRTLTQSASRWLDKLNVWVSANPELTSNLVAIAGAVAGFAAVLGGVGLIVWPVMAGINALVAGAGLLSAIFSIAGGAIVAAISAITWPVVAVGLAIVAGVLLIRKYWEPISAFFAGVVEGLGIAFAPLQELFAPLKPVFDWLGEKLQAVWQWFKNLLEPVKSTQDTLNSCKDAGVMFGQAITNALTAPLQAFNKLRQGVDWLLEKLGIIKDESADIDKTAAKAGRPAPSDSHAPVTSEGAQSDSYAPAAPVSAPLDNPNPFAPPAGMLTGAGYTPVSAGGGRSYVDRSTHHYQISAGSGAGGQDSSSQIRAELEARDRARAAQQRSRMDND